MRFLALIALATLGLIPAASRAHAADDASRLSLEAARDTVRTDADGIWNWNVRLLNGMDVGYYGDSLVLTSVDRDAAADSPARVEVRPLMAMRSLIQTLGTQDSVVMQFSIPAPFEHADLVLRVVGHTNAGGSIVREVPLVADGGAITDQFPSRLLTVGAGKVEVVPMAGLNSSGSAPGVLLIAPGGTRARALLRTGLLLQRRGWNVMIVGLPGAGRSTANRAAGAGLAAVNAAWSALLAEPGVDARRTAVWGRHDGAALAVRLAATAKQSPAVFLESAEWSDPSLPADAARVKGAMFVLHGEQDPGAPVSAARAFEAAAKARGAAIEARYLPGGHDLPSAAVLQSATKFLKQSFEPKP
jgi:predicted esterase